MDITEVRAETPGCSEVVHFNNAGAALQPRPVLDAVIEHLELEARSGGYEAATLVTERLAASYDSLARLLGANPGEIAYAENATRAWDLAFHSIPFRRGDRILTTSSEYASNAIAFLLAVKRHGVTVEVIPDAPTGQLSLEALADLLGKGGVRLVAINHVPTYDGLINPAAEVGALAREAGALFLLDACQTVGQLDLDVTEIGCDILSGAGRKYLRGPRGTGFLYVSDEIVEELEPPMLDLRGASWTGPESLEISKGAQRFETWERSVAGQLGLGAATDYALAIGMREIERRVLALGALLRSTLREVPGVTLLDRGVRQCGIVTFVFYDSVASEVKRRLADQKINVQVTEQTYRYDAGVAPAPRLRASAHYYNTRDEIDHLANALS